MNNTYNNNTIMSLEEEDSSKRNNTGKNKIKSNNSTKSNSSLFGRIFNSVYKIGQGLKSIMSMKFNIENEDELNPDLYNQISNRFNMKEEMSLIDAPSFMEESFVKDNSNRKNESNIMMTSKNEINNKDLNKNNKVLDTIENFNKSLFNQKEEIINTDILPNEKSKLSFKSLLLNKKRNNDNHLENIYKKNEEEEEKNEEENIINNTSINNNKVNNENRINKSNTSTKMNISFSKELNKTRNSKFFNNTSIMSLENIKKEINKRREENLRNVEEMQKRHGLNYDEAKEREMRNKILEEYYKDKAKRIAEGKLQMEQEKKKREEEFKKLKIKKVSGIKYTSIKKNPPLLTEIKNTEIHFKPNNNTKLIENSKKEELKVPRNEPESNDISVKKNFSFANSIIEKDEKKEEIKNINFSKTKETINVPPKINNEQKSIFGFNNSSIEDNNNNKQKKENEIKPNFSSISNPLTSTNNLPNQEKTEKKETINLFGLTGDNNKKELNFNSQIKFDNKKQSVFGNLLNNQTPEKKSKEEPKPKNDIKQDDFFNSSNNLNYKDQNSIQSLFKGDNNDKGIFRTQPTNEKGGLFDQNNSVSQGINSQSLFNSNKLNNNSGGGSSLLNQDNPFIQSKAPTQNTLFGLTNNNDNNQNQKKSLFGDTNNIFGNKSNTRSLFG